MVNNSHVIEVVDGTTFKSLGTITGLNSPRYFYPVNDQKAYVTDLYAKAIWIVNPSTYKLIKKISYMSGKGDEFYGWTEQMLQVGDKVWVCGVKTGQIAILDPNKDSIVDSIHVGIKPQWLCQDKEGKVWVMCNANYEQQLSKLHRIDPATNKIMQSFTFPTITDNPIRMKLNPTQDTIFYINQGIYKMSIHATALSTTFISSGGRNLYGLGIDPEDASIYAADGVDNVQPGMVYHYSRTGQLISSFGTGVSPSDFLFVKK
jgi:DNA-binding beta-propeller fold protein YncE